MEDNICSSLLKNGTLVIFNKEGAVTGQPESGSSFGIERDDNTYFARLLVAEFIKRVADDNKTQAWYWAVRGNCNFSFNRL